MDKKHGPTVEEIRERPYVEAAVRALAAETGRGKWEARRHTKPDTNIVAYSLLADGCDFQVILALRALPDGGVAPALCHVVDAPRKDRDPGASMDGVSGTPVADTGKLVHAALDNARHRARYRLLHLGQRVIASATKAAKRGRKAVKEDKR